MAKYQKYVMMGVTTILLPLGKLILNNMKNKRNETSIQDFAGKENEADDTSRR